MKKNLLLGVGNDIRGDDAIGEEIAREFRRDGWDVEDCGTMPENFIPHIDEGVYEEVIIVDAADMGLKPGEIRRVPRNKLGVFTMSTHALPLSLVMDFLAQKVESVVLVGIQPKDMSLKEGMSSELKKAKEYLLRMLMTDEWRYIPVL
ncbi:MAG: hydrogenase 3 maturation endopeptidase HyCI [Thermoplasmata archaeon]